MKRAILALCLTLALNGAQAFGAALPKGDVIWRLPADLYPHNVTLLRLGPTNKNMQFIFGAEHGVSFAALGRLGGRGWLQQAVQNDQAQAGFALVYGVSYYPTDVEAARAMYDVASRIAGMTVLADVGDYGRIYEGPADKYYLIFSAFAAGNITVEQGCFVLQSERARYGQTVESYCTEERNALAQTLAAVAQPPASPSPSPTPVS